MLLSSSNHCYLYVAENMLVPFYFMFTISCFKKITVIENHLPFKIQTLPFFSTCGLFLVGWFASFNPSAFLFGAFQCKPLKNYICKLKATFFCGHLSDTVVRQILRTSNTTFLLPGSPLCLLFLQYSPPDHCLPSVNFYTCMSVSC